MYIWAASGKKPATSATAKFHIVVYNLTADSFRALSNLSKWSFLSEICYVLTGVGGALGALLVLLDSHTDCTYAL
jgi:hypothetical protein